MKAATLLTLASTAFVLVSAAPSEAIKRSPEPEPEPEPVPEPDLMTGGSPLDGVMCGLSGYPRVNIPDLATNQASNGFLGELQSKTGSINGGEGPNACTQVSCANGVAVSFCNDLFPASVPYSTISKYAYDISVVCFDGGKTNNGRKTFLDWDSSTRWYVTVAGGNCS